MTTGNFLPDRYDLVLWRPDVATFQVAFTDVNGQPVPSTGDWVATFDSGSGKIDVDDSQAATGLLTVSIVDASTLGCNDAWRLQRTDIDLTYLHGSVIAYG